MENLNARNISPTQQMLSIPHPAAPWYASGPRTPGGGPAKPLKTGPQHPRQVSLLQDRAIASPNSIRQMRNDSTWSKFAPEDPHARRGTTRRARNPRTGTWGDHLRGAGPGDGGRAFAAGFNDPSKGRISREQNTCRCCGREFTQQQLRYHARMCALRCIMVTDSPSMASPEPTAADRSIVCAAGGQEARPRGAHPGGTARSGCLLSV